MRWNDRPHYRPNESNPRAERAEVVSRVLSIARNTFIRVLASLGPLSLVRRSAASLEPEEVGAVLCRVPGGRQLNLRVLTGV